MLAIALALGLVKTIAVVVVIVDVGMKILRGCATGVIVAGFEVLKTLR